MVEIQGYVEHIVFRNEDNGYSVLNVAEGAKEYCLVGIFLTISEAESLAVLPWNGRLRSKKDENDHRDKK